MNATVQNDVLPWYRQFWPWFVIGLPATAVIASFVTLWIAIGATPDRIDGFGAMAIPVELTDNRETLTFDMGAPLPDESWPKALQVTVVSRNDGRTQQLQARRIDQSNYESPIAALAPGAHEVTIVDEDSALRLRGSWAYPAPVWKLRADE